MGITGNDRAWKEELTAGEIFFCLFFGTLLFAKGDRIGILGPENADNRVGDQRTSDCCYFTASWMDGISLIRGKGSPCFHDGNYRDERGICAEGISDRACDLDRMLCHHGIACTDRKN